MPNRTKNDVYYRRQISCSTFIHLLQENLFFNYLKFLGEKGLDRVSSILFSFNTIFCSKMSLIYIIFCDSTNAMCWTERECHCSQIISLYECFDTGSTIENEWIPYENIDRRYRITIFLLAASFLRKLSLKILRIQGHSPRC